MADCTLERLLHSRTSRAIAILALLTGAVSSGEGAPAAGSKVTSVRFWSLGEATRVSIEVSSDFKIHSERLIDPDRIFFDIQGARPAAMEKTMHVIKVGDALVRQIRVAETQPGVTRVVLDLEPHKPGVEFTASQLSHPDRLMVELRLKDKPAPPATGSVTGGQTISESAGRAVEADLETGGPAPGGPAAVGPAPVGSASTGLVPVGIAAIPPPTVPAAPVTTAKAAARKFQAPFLPSNEPRAVTGQPEWLNLPVMATYVAPMRAPLAVPVKLAPPAAARVAKTMAVAPPAPAPLPAKHPVTGEESLTRALGLKLGRVVIDPGHGGQDIGTHGPAGVFEKDVVLDVAKRLATLLETRLGSEVVFTREDDTFIPLQERTKIANEHKADLFLSIHANSSPVRSVSGVETYILNFTTSKTAMDLAARENASSESSIFDLKDMIQKIAMKDKIDESREFASRIQTSLYSVSEKSNAATKNRGIKRAPFVVLIGASMPSVLAEIGFLTNSADEALLSRPEHRQKIADALYRGIAAYADSLSHFQVVAKRE
ncbi:MAG TPA: N-acetylmuramoyl-L-alanine amidase [Bryobacteraceae bacterium]